FADTKSSWGRKAAIAGTAYVAGLALDHMIPQNPNDPYSAVAAFSPTTGGNLILGGFTGLATAVPEEFRARKIGIIATGIAASMAYNWWETAHSDLNQAKVAADEAHTNDLKTRTASSLNAEIDAWKKLGEYRPYMLDLKVQDVTAPDKKPTTDQGWDDTRR